MAAMMPGMMKQNVSVPKTIVESMWRAPRGGKRRKEESTSENRREGSGKNNTMNLDIWRKI
jgi:hypothetical protein